MANNKEKVFGVGLSKTGTTSLTRALQELGYKAVHYPRNFQAIEEHDAATDLLVAINYKKLDKLYPNARFILTTRNDIEWLSSVKRHRNKIHTPKEGTLAYKLRKQALGCVEYNEKKLLRAKRKHEKSVQKYFKRYKDKLLVMDISAGDGWGELCTFLGVAVPSKIFPKENVKSKASLIEQRRRESFDSLAQT